MQVVLVMFRSDGERRSFSVVRNMTVIGRREDCDLRIPVGDVSRKHCRLVRTDASIRIEDLGSSNGTFVNGSRVQESELQAGNIVGIGPVQFIVQIDGVPDENEMTPPAERAAAPIDDEDSLIGHQMPQGEISPDDELGKTPEEEFKIDDELPAPQPNANDSESAELSLEESPAAEEALSLSLEPEPVAEMPAGGITDEEFSLDENPLEELSLTEEPLAEAPAESLASDPEPVDLQPTDAPGQRQLASATLPTESVSEEEIPLEEMPLEEAALAAVPIETTEPGLSASHAAGLVDASPAEEPIGDDFEFLDEIEPAPAAPIALEDSPSAVKPLGDDFEFLDEVEPDPVATAAPTSPLALETSPSTEKSVGDEFDFLDELVPASPAAAPPAPPLPPPDLRTDELLPMNSAKETIEHVDFDSDETLPHDGTEPTPLDTANESDWDFVIEETDHTNHDFKVDLDTPHQQPHGQT